MVRAAATVGRIPMTRQDDLRVQFCGAGNRRVEIVNFKPEEYAVSRGDVGIAEGSVVVLHIPPVQLKDQSSL